MGKFDMQGKVAIVTGGAQGLGRQITEEFCRRGASVVIADLNGDTGIATESQLQREGFDVLFVQGDISDGSDVGRLFAKTIERYGKVDYLVNNASLLTRKKQSVHEVDPDFMAANMRVNVVGTFMCMQHAISQMLSQDGGGAIVNISSTVAVIATQGMVCYGASKAAINNMTEVAAAEYASSGIRVNAVMPGAMLTEAMAAFKEDNPEAFQAVSDNIPLKRMAEPIEVARVAVWLCSDDAGYITGDKILVDGGQYVQNIN